jgi:hypothetical protein
MNLFLYYRRAVLYPALFILFFCIISSALGNYKSGWVTTKTVIFMSFITSLIYSAVVCILSLTIFLNRFNRLNKNLIWNILTWFLLPVGYIGIALITDISNRIKYGFGFGTEFLYLLVMTLPFVVGLGLTFIRYRRKIT